ncbi:MAG: glycerol kinase GlpK [Pirellulales bacterium]
MSQLILALDQGTTSSRSILFNHQGQIVASAQKEFRQILPEPGNVEHDPEDIWQSQLDTAREVLSSGKVNAADIAAIGITNQRETTVLWDRTTGKPVANAIVWQSRVSSPVCDQLKANGHEALIRQKTGLVVDAYFSGTKIKHLLDTMPGLRERAERGEILFGTVDTFLVWRLTGGKCHVTDVSNASRTMLLDIHTCQWDDELLKILDVPRAMLPEVCDSSQVYGETDPELLGQSIPIAGIAGDQQAATFGQTCFETGSVKNTYGTGCFMLMNIGDTPLPSQNNLLTTVGWRINNQTTYCLEGSVFIAGAVVQWLRDGLGIIENSEDVQALSESVADAGGVYFVPALVGLGAPYWDPHARGMIIGISRGTTAGHIARAAVESMAFQTRDLVEAMQKDADVQLSSLQVDGRASVNNPLMQFQANLLGTQVRRPQVSETTALGAAYLAGLAVGYWSSLEQLKNNWQLDQEFQPEANTSEQEARYGQWKEAVSRCRNWSQATSE